jgi:hypothetical protein
MIEYQVTIEKRATYLHARVVGQRTPENMLAFLRQVHEACVRSKRMDVLLEIQMSGPSLDPFSIFRVVSSRAEDGAKLGKIAYVESSMGDKAKAKMAESTAANRSVNVRLFDDVAGAVRWLEGEIGRVRKTRKG